MSKRTRRILFYFAIILFMGACFIAITYAQGYKYSFREKEFQRTGAIQLKVNDDAKVFLDDELQGSTSLFGNSYGIDGLLPGTYVVRLEREGFTPWQKTMEVHEGFVTSFSRIIILPLSEAEAPKILEEIEEIMLADDIITQTPSPTPSATPRPTATPRSTRSPAVTASASGTPLPDDLFILENKILYIHQNGTLKQYAVNVEGFQLSENNRKILWWGNRDLWVGWLNDTDYQPYKKNGDREPVLKFAAPIERAAWFRGEDHIVVDSSGFKIVELDKRGGQNIIRL